MLLRAEPEDFRVEEDLGFAPAGAGQHLLVRVRKRDANTAWVAEQLAALAGCRVAEVGYAGLKDRRAVAVQWFSLPRPRAPLEVGALRGTGFEALELQPHNRKLPRGALAGNHFAIRLRALHGSGAELAATLSARLVLISREGVPNYFGPQRFGREGANLARLPRRCPRCGPPSAASCSPPRAVSSSTRCWPSASPGSWGRLLPGDLATLDGRGSFFAVDSARCDPRGARGALNIHPSGPMWGQGQPGHRGRWRARDARGRRYRAEAPSACRPAWSQERRSLRLAVRELAGTRRAGRCALATFRLRARLLRHRGAARTHRRSRRG